MKHATRMTVVMALLAFVPQVHATVWGAKSLAPAGGAASSAPTHLFRFEEDLTGGVADLGAITLPGGTALDVDGLAISTADGLLGYALSGAGSQLVSIDTSTAIATPIGSALSGREIRGACFVGGMLYVIDAASDELLRIDPASGSVLGVPLPLTLAGPPFDASTGADLAVAVSGAVYLVSANTFFLIDLSTGALTLAFADMVPADGCASNPMFLVGATFSDAGAADTLFTFEANCSDDLYDYDVGAGFPRTLLVADILSGFNAGRGDLAALVSPPPVPSQGARTLTGLGLALMLLLTCKTMRRIC